MESEFNNKIVYFQFSGWWGYIVPGLRNLDLGVLVWLNFLYCSCTADANLLISLTKSLWEVCLGLGINDVLSAVGKKCLDKLSRNTCNDVGVLLCFSSVQ